MVETAPAWKVKAEAHVKARDALFPSEWLIPKDKLPPASLKNVQGIPRESGLLTEKELEITEASTATLLDKLAIAEWSSYEVTLAFCKRATIAQQLVNCLTEVHFESALAIAKSLDEQLASTGKTVGPLHGLPISFKDQFCIKGSHHSVGFIAWLEKKATQDCVMVEILKKAGAVPFVSTNVPQTLMRAETYNNLFGRTLNPFNRTLTCGGSSGGEGSLIGFRGSPLGVGTDLGGSVRIPAAMQNLWGLRPSFYRLPYQGALNTLEGFEVSPSVAGPISTSYSGIVEFTKAVIQGEPWLHDPVVVEKKWNQDEFELKYLEGKKCFGILWDDGVVRPQPPVRRALQMTKDALLAAGHEVIDWIPYKAAETDAILIELFESDGGVDLNSTAALSGEPLVEGIYLGKKHLTVYESWQINKRRRVIRKEHLDYWNATVSQTTTGRPVDAIISCVAPFAAPPHGEYRYANYTHYVNVHDHAAAVFPVTSVDPELDVIPPKPDSYFSEKEKTIWEQYDPARYEDAPVALQLIGRRMREEEVLGLTGLVADALKIKC